MLFLFLDYSKRIFEGFFENAQIDFKGPLSTCSKIKPQFTV